MAARASTIADWCWWGVMQGRARTVGQVLLGYYNIPTGMGTPVNIIINPVGDAMRSEPRQGPVQVFCRNGTFSQACLFAVCSEPCLHQFFICI